MQCIYIYIARIRHSGSFTELNTEASLNWKNLGYDHSD